MARSRSVRNSAPCDPGQRIPPIQNQRQAREHLRGHVATAHVRQFVQQHDAAQFAAPTGGVAGHEYGRAQDAEGHRHASGGGFQHLHRVPDAESARQFHRQVAIRRWRTRAPHAPHGGAGDQHLREQCHGARHPKQHQPERPIRTPRRQLRSARAVRSRGDTCAARGFAACRGRGLKYHAGVRQQRARCARPAGPAATWRGRVAPAQPRPPPSRPGAAPPPTGRAAECRYPGRAQHAGCS